MSGDLDRGRQVYNERCYFCHGYNGDAKTLAASYLQPPPRNFTRTDMRRLSRERMIEVVSHGKPDTAMKGFASLLSAADIAAVVDYVRHTFMERAAVNTYYHTPENGWPDHERYRAAFPFALGEIALDTPWEQLTSEQQAGKRLFMGSCITCHDRARVRDEGAVWDPRAVSFPRGGFSLDAAPDATSGATPYAKHDVPPVLHDLSAPERRGEALFQANCAFCHAADGTGRNWIGRFLEPHPRDLTGPAMRDMTRARLKTVIRDGLPGTTMSAWKEVLSDADIEAVIAYIARAFHPLAAEAPRRE